MILNCALNKTKLIEVPAALFQTRSGVTLSVSVRTQHIYSGDMPIYIIIQIQDIHEVKSTNIPKPNGKQIVQKIMDNQMENEIKATFQDLPQLYQVSSSFLVQIFITH